MHDACENVGHNYLQADIIQSLALSTSRANHNRAHCVCRSVVLCCFPPANTRRSFAMVSKPCMCRHVNNDKNKQGKKAQQKALFKRKLQEDNLRLQAEIARLRLRLEEDEGDGPTLLQPGAGNYNLFPHSP
eukprot:COSAG05_NODE_561_length_8675_cov_3.694846_4_plen_131_part_00